MSIKATITENTFKVKFTRFMHDDAEPVEDLHESKVFDEFFPQGYTELGQLGYFMAQQSLALFQFNKELKTAFSEFRIVEEGEKDTFIKNFEFHSITYQEDVIEIVASITLTQHVERELFIDGIQHHFYDGFAGMSGQFEVMTPYQTP